MFERFTHTARRTVELAQLQARALGHGYIGTEHLVLALVSEDLGAATLVLQRSGIEVSNFSALLGTTLGTAGEDWARDADALRTIGIDLDEIRKRVRRPLGPARLMRDRSRRARERGAGDTCRSPRNRSALWKGVSGKPSSSDTGTSAGSTCCWRYSATARRWARG
ncbi:MAG: Clp protease N-terminal domain-containing protein [Actinomycetota bacterium]